MAKRKVLIVDDSEIVLAMAREALAEGGFETVTAMNGIEANRYIFSGDRPDLIILDVMLPMLDGNKKAKMLKSDEKTGDIPILLISSKPEDELRRLTEECGADGYIRKPFTNSQMVTMVDETLAKAL
jgi:two-component system, OmpR family, alkaline phosphatase synthesis response regulator PhoP